MSSKKKRGHCPSVSKIMDMFNHTCVYCGNQVVYNEGEPHQRASNDHAVPRSLGGSNDPIIVLACARCNSHRSSGSLIQFMKKKHAQYLNSLKRKVQRTLPIVAAERRRA